MKSSPQRTAILNAMNKVGQSTIDLMSELQKSDYDDLSESEFNALFQLGKRVVAVQKRLLQGTAK